MTPKQKRCVRDAGDFPAQAYLKQKIRKDSKSVWVSLSLVAQLTIFAEK